jgi:hypothetical protein
MEIRLEQTIILRLSLNETIWLKKMLVDPPISEEPPYDKKMRVGLYEGLHAILEEINY